MTIRDLVVHLGGRPAASDARLDAALALARSFDARLVALALAAEPFLPAEIGLHLPQELIRRQREEATAQAAAILAAAANRARDAGVTLETRAVTAQLGRLPDLLARQVRSFDLAVVGQPDPEDEDGIAEPLAEAAFMASGRPALVVPYIGPRAMPPERVIVAWDGSAEATRACHDALPLLARAARVAVAVGDPEKLAGKAGDPPGAEIAAHLARHGAKAEIVSLPSAGLPVGDVLLDLAADNGADLIVMGGYGHARLREIVLGGTTRHLLGRMTVPVLLAH